MKKRNSSDLTHKKDNVKVPAAKLKKKHSHVFVEVNCNQRYITDDLDI